MLLLSSVNEELTNIYILSCKHFCSREAYWKHLKFNTKAFSLLPVLSQRHIFVNRLRTLSVTTSSFYRACVLGVKIVLAVWHFRKILLTVVPDTADRWISKSFGECCWVRGNYVTSRSQIQCFMECWFLKHFVLFHLIYSFIIYIFHLIDGKYALLRFTRYIMNACDKPQIWQIVAMSVSRYAENSGNASTRVSSK